MGKIRSYRIQKNTKEYNLNNNTSLLLELRIQVNTNEYETITQQEAIFRHLQYKRLQTITSEYVQFGCRHKENPDIECRGLSLCSIEFLLHCRKILVIRSLALIFDDVIVIGWVFFPWNLRLCRGRLNVFVIRYRNRDKTLF